MPVTAWNTPNIKYRRLFSDKELASGASQTFEANLPWAADQMYWYYATPSETQDNYPQEIWIERVSVKVISHAKFKVGVKVVNGSNSGVCKFHIWQAVAAKTLDL
jgi:hypothetical protein